MMTTPPQEDSTNAVESVNEAAATEAAPGEPPDPDEPGDSDPASAVEVLWYEVARVEAITWAANQALEFLRPRPSVDPEDQRAVERVHILVTLAAEVAEEALAEADSQLARLGKHVPERRAVGEQP
jgi:hypothetical protein